MQGRKRERCYLSSIKEGGGTGAGQLMQIKAKLRMRKN